MPRSSRSARVRVRFSAWSSRVASVCPAPDPSLVQISGDVGMTDVQSQRQPSFAGPTEGGDPRVADVRRRLNAAHAASETPPQKAATKLASQNKPDVRKRIWLLLDEGSFVEEG